jgi:hypothetical protein
MSMLSRDPAVSAAREQALIEEALIREARRLQRRRRRRVGLAILVIAASAVGAAVAAGSGGAGPGRQEVSRSASAAQIRAFLAEARRGASGTFSVTYAVTAVYAGGRVRRVNVAAAQSPGLLYYRETPSLSVSSPAGPPQSASYEVFVASGGSRRAGVGEHGRHGLVSAGTGLFSCMRGSLSSPWSCTGPYQGIGMGTTGQLLGPYPPQSLLRGLQNATETYTGEPVPPPAARRERAFLFTRRLADQNLSCLGFGPASHPLGTVCLELGGIIASYHLQATASFIGYATATLRSYSPLVQNGTFTLPVTPHNGG